MPVLESFAPLLTSFLTEVISREANKKYWNMQKIPERLKGLSFPSKQLWVDRFSTVEGAPGRRVAQVWSQPFYFTGVTWILQIQCKWTAVKKRKKKSKTRSSLALVTTAGVISLNHRIVHLKALLAQEKPQAGSSKAWRQLRSLTAEGGGRVQRLDAKASFSFSQLHRPILAKFPFIEYEAQVTSCPNERC